MVYLNSISGPLVNISVFERILKWFMLSLQRMFCRLSNYSAKMTIGQKEEGVFTGSSSSLIPPSLNDVVVVVVVVVVQI